jgi:hypothetical protein
MSEGPPGSTQPDVVSGLRMLGGASEQRGGNWHHRFPRMRVLAAVAIATAAAVAGVTAEVLASPGRQAPSALATVRSALATTSAASYSFEMDTAVPSLANLVAPIAVSGAFDPVHRVGTEVLTTRSKKQPEKMQIRFIGKYVYTWVSGTETVGAPWNKAPVPPAGASGLPMNDPYFYGFITDEPVSPAGLASLLGSAGEVRKAGLAGGPGWSGVKYAFTARLFGGKESLSGTVDVDQQRRVRKLVIIARQGKVVIDRAITFSDFGAPVPVTAPAVSQVKATSTPYSGYYF